MTGYYTGKVEAGKIYACKRCGRLPTIGEERFYEKKGDNWIGCVDKKCFIEQGGSSEPATKGGGKFTSQKFPISEFPSLYKISEDLLDSFLAKRKGTPEEPTLQTLTTSEQSIFVLSIFRTLSQNFKP